MNYLLTLSNACIVLISIYCNMCDLSTVNVHFGMYNVSLECMTCMNTKLQFAGNVFITQNSKIYMLNTYNASELQYINIVFKQLLLHRPSFQSVDELKINYKSNCYHIICKKNE